MVGHLLFWRCASLCSVHLPSIMSFARNNMHNLRAYGALLAAVGQTIIIQSSAPMSIIHTAESTTNKSQADVVINRMLSINK